MEIQKKQIKTKIIIKSFGLKNENVSFSYLAEIVISSY